MTVPTESVRSGVPAWAGAQASEGERSEPERDAATAHADRGGRLGSPPDPEVRTRGRRTFTAEYKAAILRELEACQEAGQVGALLRREGLHSSHLVAWRRKRREAERRALAPLKRGPKGRSSEAKRIEDLERENARLREEVRVTRRIIEAQKKLHELLGIPLPDTTDVGRR